MPADADRESATHGGSAGYAAYWREIRDAAPRLSLSCLWFFLVLFSYYCLKPLRDALGTNFSNRLGSLYLATFLSTMVALGVYSWLVSHLPRRKLLFVIHQFFAACLIAFYLAIADLNRCPELLAGIFFVWVSVFSLYTVTLFWSAITDLFSKPDAKKWFGTIAASGSIGSVSGSYLAGVIAQKADARQLFLVAIVALELAVLVGWRLIRYEIIRGDTSVAQEDQGTGGSIVAGITRVFHSKYLLGICCFAVLGKTAATFIYNLLQVQLSAEAIDAHARTQLFSQISFYGQLGSFLLQGFVVGLLIRFLGLGLTLVIPCAVFGLLFSWIVWVPSLATLANAHAIQQIVSYGILVPGQHLLFTVVSREDKYKAKGFIDTVVFRASDVAAANACDSLIRRGVSAVQMSIGMLPVTIAWLGLGLALGRAFRNQSKEQRSAGNP